MNPARVQELVDILDTVAAMAVAEVDHLDENAIGFHTDYLRAIEVSLAKWPNGHPDVLAEWRQDAAFTRERIVDYNNARIFYLDRHAQLRSLQAELEADLYAGQLVLDHFEESLQEMRRRTSELTAYGSWTEPADLSGEG